MSEHVTGEPAGQRYHKIKTVWTRDPADKYKTLIPGAWATEAFAYLKSLKWVWTEKVDGTNIRIHYIGGRWPEDGRVMIGGRGDKSDIPAGLHAYLKRTFTVMVMADQFKMLKALETVTLYGEGYGPGIQKGGGNYRDDKGFILFDVRYNETWLEQKSVEVVAEELDINVVPVIGTGTLTRMVSRVKTGMKSTFGDFQAEGIVARPVTGLADRYGKRVITKVKVKDFKP